MAKLYYQGHASYRLTANDGRVIYIDPSMGDGYDVPADLILVTHQHKDHNRVDKCAKKPACHVITNEDALKGGRHNRFDVIGIPIQSVMAKNRAHNPKRCVGYILTLDDVKIYASGDTSMTEQMKEFAALHLDYALFPGDGTANMGLKEAAECARIVGAKHNIIIHLRPGATGILFSRKRAEKWNAPHQLIVEPGEEITLTHSENGIE